jgi:ring-1,2-phenylacetyl-CoA epoxidase subunit PaaA
MFRKYGLKQRKNEDMRADYMNRVKDLLDSLGLKMPEASAAA